MSKHNRNFKNSSNSKNSTVKESDGNTSSKVQETIVKEKKTRKPTDQFFLTTKKVNQKLKQYPEEMQTANGKAAAVRQVIAADKQKRFTSEQRFWAEASIKATLLDRAVDLKKYCDDYEINYQAVKQHMVLEGLGFMKDIVLNGIAGKEALIKTFGGIIYTGREWVEDIKEAGADTKKEEGADE